MIVVYNDYVNSMNADITFTDISSKNIKNLNFNSIWNSDASEKLITALNDNMKAIDELKKQFDMFTSALLLVDEYVEISKKISALELQLNCIVADDFDAVNIRGIILSCISGLEVKKKDLKVKIDSLLNAITKGAITNVYDDVNAVGISENSNVSLIDRYLEVTNEIFVLRNQYNNMSGNGIETQNERKKINEKIAQLEKEKKKLEAEITISVDVSDEDIGNFVEENSSDESNNESSVDISLSASDVVTSDNGWNGPKLHAKAGFNANGPQAYETWCPLDVSNIVNNMEKLYGHTNVENRIREDGVQVISGITPEGVVYKDLVIVAADVYHPSANPNGTFQRGEIVDTSLGKGIIVDLCGKAVEKREAGKEVHFDIYAAWWDEPWYSQIYDK